MTQSISVIIPTLNASRCLGGMLAILARQTVAPGEVIVVDSSSDDTTADVARAAGCRVVVIPRSEFGHGRTRNLGAEIATGEVLVYLSQDVVPSGREFLDRLTEPLRSGRAVAAYARQLPHAQSNPLDAFTRHFNYPPTPSIRTADDIDELGVRAFFFSNAASTCVKDTFLKVGGFPEDVIINEDMALCARFLRAGYAVCYQAHARVFHSHDFRMREQFRRYFDMGVFFGSFEEFRNVVRIKGEGMRFAVAQLGYLVGERSWVWIPRSGIESALKFAAFNLGRYQSLIPLMIKKRMSLHPAYWDRR